MARWMVLALLLALAGPAWAQPSVDALRVYLGTSGSTCTLHSGSGAPSTSLGAVCDVYVRTDSPYTVYTKTGASTWTALAPMPASAAVGDLLTATSATGTGRVAAVAVGQVLASAGTSTAPAYTASPSLTSIGGAANLTLNPTGDLVLNPTGNDVLPGTGYDINLGALTNKYLTLHAAELVVETLVAQDTLATIGGRVLVGPTTTLTADLAPVATTISVKHNQIQNGDRIVMQADGKYERMLVTSVASGSGPYTYSVTRNTDGSGANQWYAGDAVFNTGTTGNGFIDLYSVNGLYPGTTAGPSIVGNVRTGTGDTDIAPRWALGNLNGLYGYGTNIYGAAFGDNANAWVKIDPTNGVRLGHGGTTYVDITAGGTATFSGRLTVGTGRNWIANSEFMRGRGAGDHWRTYWGGSSGTTTVDPSADFACGVPCFQRAVHGSGWSWGGIGGNALGTVNVGLASAAQSPLGSRAMYAAVVSATPADTTFHRIWGPLYAVRAGQPYEYSIYVGTGGGAWSIRARINWWGEDGVDAGDQPDYISEEDMSTTCSSGTASPDLGTWCRAGGIATAPSGARLAHLSVIMTYDGGDANPVTYITRPYFGEAQPGQTQLTPWGPGGQTLITGDMLSTDLVIANTLRSAGATALDTGTGFWLDASSTPTFRVGNPAGNQMRWDGTNLTFGQGQTALDSTGLTITMNTAQTLATANAVRFPAPDGGLSALGGGYDSAGKYLYLQVENDSDGDYGRLKLIAKGETDGGSERTASIEISAGYLNGSDLLGEYITLDATRVNITQQLFWDQGTSTSLANIRQGGIAYNSQYGLVIVPATPPSDYDLTIANAAANSIVFAVPANTDDAYFGATTAVRMATFGAGTLQTDGSGNLSVSSDARLKEGVLPWDVGLEAVRGLRPVSFNWAESSGLDTSHRYVGFIAQEVAELIPDAVGVSPDGLLSLSDRPIIAALVRAIQELSAKVEALERRQEQR